VLVPTTVLAQQHLNTFEERMAGYPVVVEMLSRFRTKQEQRRILAETATGGIDILIGTHRLIQADVKFKDVGLVVIDEEQRFGVKHKEVFKQWRATVDVLSMSATPIPRTLYLALTGARDLSAIETPPMNRHPIQTIVRSYDEKIIVDAVRHEVRRGGQVFYLHNRVLTIDTVARHLRALLPDLSIGVGHGKMGEGELEHVMTDFVAGRYHVLVCTTIIESGLDIPNCNTIIIEGADRFGLSQLYQLRGRVGRFKHQAYAYLLLHRHGRLMDVARQRLNAIRQHNQLGAGFRIAMRDLELRGAGNLLGREQSGHIDAVGYELYCRLLAEAIRRRGIAHPGIENFSLPMGQAAVLAFPVDAYVPDSYCESPALKFELHKALEGCRQARQLRDLARRSRDRYGPLPDPVLRLFRARAVTMRCRELGIGRVEVAGRQIRLHLLGGLPGEITTVQLPELLHIQADGPVLVLFTRLQLQEPDSALGFLLRLLGLDDGYLAAGA
jgi:transcription-repair coupling factor (superfamily II helicase)